MFSSTLNAQEHLLNYQGRITEEGAPFDGTAQLTFTLYDANDNQMWEEQHQSVEIQQGIFHVLLGSVDSIPEELFTEHDELYLGITINDGAEMEPRSRITSVAYSARSNSAATVDDGAITTEKIETFAVTSSKIAQGAVTGTRLADNITINTTGNIRSEGIFEIRRDGDLRLRGTEAVGNAGFFQSYGPNGEPNARITHQIDAPNHGEINVRDADGNNQAFMHVNAAGQGVVSADIKSFRIQNPSNPNTEIVYASLEGPEVGAYYRGTAKLENGKGRINFPRHFIDVASLETLTIQVTPLSAESLGLAVAEKSLENGIVVRELQNGNGTYEFDFTVKSARSGYEDWEVIRENTEGTQRQEIDEPAGAADER